MGMKTDFDGLAKLADVFFNGRKAAAEAEERRVSKPLITVRDLVARKRSMVRCDGKIYEIVVTEVVVTK